MNFYFYGMISPIAYIIAYIIVIFFGSFIYRKMFIKLIKSANHFGYIMDSKEFIVKKMNSLKPSQVKNLINELSIFKFSSFITYVGFIIALLSFVIGQLNKTSLQSYIVIAIIAAMVIILGSLFTWVNYNNRVHYVKEYIYENFDENTYELKNNIKKP